MRFVLIAGILASLADHSVGAQTLSLMPGTRVRIEPANGPVIVGTLLRSSEDSLVVRPQREDQELALSKPVVRSMQISKGRSAGKGAKWGFFLASAVSGTLVAIDVAQADCTDCQSFGVMIGAAASLAAGGVGALVGAVIRPEIWEKVPLAARTSFQPGRVGISVGIPGMH